MPQYCLLKNLELFRVHKEDELLRFWMFPVRILWKFTKLATLPKQNIIDLETKFNNTDVNE